MTKLTEGNGWSFEPAKSKLAQAKTGSLSPDKQEIRLRLEKRNAGKIVTLISGLILSTDNREKLARDLKTACGTGGTIHEGKIELQGDQRERAKTWLLSKGWRVLS